MTIIWQEHTTGNTPSTAALELPFEIKISPIYCRRCVHLITWAINHTAPTPHHNPLHTKQCVRPPLCVPIRSRNHSLRRTVESKPPSRLGRAPWKPRRGAVLTKCQTATDANYLHTSCPSHHKDAHRDPSCCKRRRVNSRRSTDRWWNQQSSTTPPTCEPHGWPMSRSRGPDTITNH